MSVLSAAGISSDAKQCLSLWLLLFARTGFSCCCCIVVGAFVFDVVRGWFALFAATPSRRAQQFPRHFFLHRSWLWADEADKRCGAFADKEFNKVICVLFTSVEEQKKFRLPAWSESLSSNAFLHIYCRAYTFTHAHTHTHTAYKQTCPTLADSASSKNTFILMPSPAFLHYLYS